MAVVGSFLFAVWLAGVTVVWCGVSLLTAPLPPLWRYSIIVVWARLALWGLRVFCRVRFRVAGERPPRRPAVFLSRHESAWEVIAYLLIFSPAVFVMKRSLFHVPFFGWGLRLMSPIPIDRSSPRQALRKIERLGRKRLECGFNVVIFPEGTRMAPAETRPYFSGGAWLAKRAGVPVVPVALDSGACWPKNAFFKFPGTITVRVGEAIGTEDLSVEAVNERAQTWINEARGDLRGVNRL